MDKSTRRHLARRGVYETTPTEDERPFAERNAHFFAWFEERVMGFDSAEYRRAFWREARRTGRSLGPRPYGMKEYAQGRGSIALYFALMGVSFFFWAARRGIDRHIRRLRRPTYYETERARRLALSGERRRLRRRTTTGGKPTMDMIRRALAQAHASVEAMVRLGSLMEDLECYVDNSPYFREDGSFAGRRGGIRRHLQAEAPDLYARYKTLMRYKALSKRFRQAVGVGDPVPASAVLPSAGKSFSADIAGMGAERKTSEGAGGDDGGLPAPFVRARSGSGGGRKTPESAGNDAADGRKAALEEARAVFRRARELISDCECSVASLAAQLARRVEPDYAPREPSMAARMAGRRRDGPKRRAAG